MFGIHNAIRVPTWGAGSTVSISGTSSSATAVTSGRAYLLCSSTDLHIIWGTSNVAAAQATDLLIPRNQVVRVDVPADVTHFRAIRDSADGTLYYVVLDGA